MALVISACNNLFSKSMRNRGVLLLFLLTCLPSCEHGDPEPFVISEAGVNDLEFCRGGSVLAVAGRNPCLLLKADDFRIEKRLKGDVTSATVVRSSLDGDAVVFVKGQVIEIVNLVTYETRTLNAPAKVNAALFSKDRTVLFSGDARGVISRWDLGEKKEKASQIVFQHDESVSCLAYSPDGTLLASGSQEEGKSPSSGQVCLWDFDTGKIKKVIKSTFGGGVTSVSFGVDGKQLVIGHRKWDSQTDTDTGILEIWDINADKAKWSIEVKDGIIWKTAFISEEFIAVAAGIYKKGGALLIVDTNGKVVIKKMLSEEAVTCLAISRKKEQVVYGTNTGRIGIVNLKPILGKKDKTP